VPAGTRRRAAARPPARDLSGARHARSLARCWSCCHVGDEVGPVERAAPGPRPAVRPRAHRNQTDSARGADPALPLRPAAARETLGLSAGLAAEVDRDAALDTAPHRPGRQGLLGCALRRPRPLLVGCRRPPPGRGLDGDHQWPVRGRTHRRSGAGLPAWRAGRLPRCRARCRVWRERRSARRCRHWPVADRCSTCARRRTPRSGGLSGTLAQRTLGCGCSRTSAVTAHGQPPQQGHQGPATAQPAAER
jgi:hypothetical protein